MSPSAPPAAGFDLAPPSPQQRQARIEGLSADERRVTVHLTDAGRDLRAKAAGIPAALGGRLVDDQASYRALHAELTALADRLERAPGPADAPA